MPNCVLNHKFSLSTRNIVPRYSTIPSEQGIYSGILSNTWFVHSIPINFEQIRVLKTFPLMCTPITTTNHTKKHIYQEFSMQTTTLGRP